MIDLEITDGVAFITLNAPATRNALNNELAGLFVAAGEAALTRSAGIRRRRTGTPPWAASTAPSPGSASWRCRP